MIEIKELIIRATAGGNKNKEEPAESKACEGSGQEGQAGKQLKKQIRHLSRLIEDKNER